MKERFLADIDYRGLEVAKGIGEREKYFINWIYGSWKNNDWKGVSK